MPPARRSSFSKFSDHNSPPSVLKKYNRNLYQRVERANQGPVASWLKSNVLDAKRLDADVHNSLKIRDIADDEVLCTVERTVTMPEDDQNSIFTESPTHTLFISARTAPSSDEDQQSPRAVLATFTGTLDDLTAPNWAHWTPTSLHFRQPRTGFLLLYSHLAMSRENSAQVWSLIVRLICPSVL
ncbi:hypothetical protein H0H81_006997 [Sphagnurus paluster]|uniref:Uncharacterized protein n=1 Tax=Sphagnurus paluster TaxID=117069 RepID=A0A9P7FTF4_9AGAR|nr:hypothetical protein H0H81_006997 [Sphagnurus paluster]